MSRLSASHGSDQVIGLIVLAPLVLTVIVYKGIRLMFWILELVLGGAVSLTDAAADAARRDQQRRLRGERHPYGWTRDGELVDRGSRKPWE